MSLEDLQDYRAYSLLPSKYELENPLLNFSRSSARKVWTPQGVTENVTANEMGYSWNPATGLYEGRPISGQFTNEVLDPLDLSTSNWAKSSVTVSNENIDSILQIGSVSKVVEDSTQNSHEINQSITVSDSTTYTIEVIAKKAERNWIIIGSKNPSNSAAWFNLDTGTAGTIQSNVESATIAELSDGRYSCTITFTTSSTSGGARLWVTTGDGTLNYQGDGSSGVYIEYIGQTQGSPKPPLPVYDDSVSGQAVTKDPDIATITNLDPWFNQDEGTFVVEYSFPAITGVQRIFELGDGTADNRITANINSGTLEFFTLKDGNVEVNLDGDTLSTNTTYKSAFAIETGNFAFVNDGTMQGTQNNADMTTQISDFSAGNTTTSFTAYLDGFIKSLIYYPKRLPDNLLQWVTTP